MSTHPALATVLTHPGIRLGYLCLTIGRFGRPSVIRTDNEAIFTGRLMHNFLQRASIHHQRIPPGQPWCNGRVERFFGTLKAKLDHWAVPSLAGLNTSLAIFADWYHHARPHQHLHGRTPAEV
ncbi:integrase core domain-containing protein, partial [Chitinivorax sp. B]|uniref:integrase core domain-containing protein n=1 Tax=Chitinivorax sp. B TaxID=2502235 RepID=UPI0010F87ACD